MRSSPFTALFAIVKKSLKRNRSSVFLPAPMQDTLTSFLLFHWPHTEVGSKGYLKKEATTSKAGRTALWKTGQHKIQEVRDKGALPRQKRKAGHSAVSTEVQDP